MLQNDLIPFHLGIPEFFLRTESASKRVVIGDVAYISLVNSKSFVQNSSKSNTAVFRCVDQTLPSQDILEEYCISHLGNVYNPHNLSTPE